MSAKLQFSPVHSIRMRVLLLVVALMVAATGLLLWYILQQFEAATTFELEQEGILLSNALEASIMPLAGAGNIPGLQTHIDRLVATQEKNDIEINIMLLEGGKSAVVASNEPDNIEATSPEEHANLLASLNEQRPVVLIEHDDPPTAAASNEFFALSLLNLSNDQRFLSLTTPLIANERKLGSINVKLSLARIDQVLAAIRWTLLAAGMVASLLVMSALILLLNFQIFNPLQRMAEKMHHIAAGDLSQRVAPRGPLNEINWLAHTFDGMIDKLQAAFNREKRFTADISHELRTPLTALKGRIGLTLTQPRAPAEYERTLKKLEKEVDRLARLSNDLLFLARLEQGQLRPHLEEQDFSNLLGAIVDQMQPLAEDKGVTLIEQISSELTIQGDADHLIRLFINLLDNAIKYTPLGGQVSVRAESKGQAILTTINDTGPGISPEHLSLLFDRFYRVEGDRSRSSGGAGLGLAIAYEIARAHRGTIKVDSAPGLGSTFIVHLPTSPLPRPK
jgi:heavy metal sensor kinase